MSCAARRGTAGWAGRALVLSSLFAALAPAPALASDLPIPCAPLLAPPLCTPVTAPTPAASNPAPAAQPHSTPRPGATPSPSPSPRPLVISGALGVSGVIDDPALSAKVTEVLQHPVTAERPSLLHFSTAAASRHHPAAPPASPDHSPWAIAGLILIVLALGGLVGALIWIRRTSLRLLTAALPRPHLGAALSAGGQALGRGATLGRSAGRRLIASRARLVAAVGLLVPAVVLTVGLAVPSSRPPARPAGPAASRAPASPADFALTDLELLPPQLVEVARSLGWHQLIGIEHSLEMQHQQLAIQEQRVGQLTATLQNQPAGSEEGPQLVAQLQQLVSDHQAATNVYQELLQSEYDFYQGAAHNPPPQRHQLVAVAAASGHPGAAPAVSYDLQTVEAQQNQEAALHAAEAQQPAADPISALLHSVGRPTLISPMGGAIEQGFGCTSLAIEPPVSYNGRFCPHFHTGIDIAAPQGTPVHAAAAGRVILAAESVDENGQLVGYGRYVAIAHGNGFTTVYGHLESTSVRVGQLVQQGQVVGREGSTGNSTGPHLHFETRVRGSPVDPGPYLRGILHLR